MDPSLLALANSIYYDHLLLGAKEAMCLHRGRKILNNIKFFSSAIVYVYMCTNKLCFQFIYAAGYTWP